MSRLTEILAEIRAAKVTNCVTGETRHPGLSFPGRDVMHFMGTEAALAYWASAIQENTLDITPLERDLILKLRAAGERDAYKSEAASHRAALGRLADKVAHLEAEASAHTEKAPSIAGETEKGGTE